MRERPRNKERLHHILEAAKNIQAFTKDINFDKFSQDKVLQYAVVKNFEIIGEAAHHLTKDLKEQTIKLNGGKLLHLDIS